jgi:adenylate cyclase
MQKRLAELRAKWKSEGKPELKMRIGLCTGPAVVGNMGSKSRMDYTMMGDTVNTAARLEGVNKVYGIYTLISDTTYKAIQNGIMAREIDSINVVGKGEPVTVYQLIGSQSDIDNGMADTVQHYASGLEAYRNQNWDLAIQQFKSALDVSPGDAPSMTMLDRCNEYKADSPGKDWDGSFTMKTK